MTNNEKWNRPVDKAALRAKAAAFRDRHQGPDVLVLPNAWDVGSAIILTEAGFSAIATTSAGIAFAQGYADGENISREEMLAVVNRIEGATQNPDRTWSRARLFSGIHTRSKSAGYCRQAADLIPEYARLPALPIFARSGLRARPGRAREIYPC